MRILQSTIQFLKKLTFYFFPVKPTEQSIPKTAYEVNSWNVEFKRVHKTRDGKKVRSRQEKQFYNWLLANAIPFQYEPYIRVQEKKLFPDFVIGRSAIELTEGGAMNLSFQGSLKKYAHHLNSKFNYYSQVENFQTMIVVMENPIAAKKLKRYLNREIICLSGLEQLKSRVCEEFFPPWEFSPEVRGPSQPLNTEIEV